MGKNFRPLSKDERTMLINEVRTLPENHRDRLCAINTLLNDGMSENTLTGEAIEATPQEIEKVKKGEHLR